MRDYAKVSPKFWMGKTGKDLRKHGMEAQLVGLYLMTNPHSTMLGLYPLPIVYIGHETGLGLEGATKGLTGCIEAGFCLYDDDTETVWVIEMAHFQIANKLKEKDNQCAGVQKAYDDLIENPFLSMFYDKYAGDFHLTGKRESKTPYKAPSKPLAEPLRSQEQEQEQEQEKEQEQKTLVDLTADTPPKVDPIQEVFDYWRKRMSSPGSKLDKPRRKLIEGALKNYTPREVCEAIRGCSLTPHNMGVNDNNQKYNGLNVILRNADQIDRFIGTARKKPRAAAVGAEQTEEQYLADVQAALDKLNGHAHRPAADDPNIIDMENPDA